MQSLKEIATKHSATCFLNSFLREWPLHTIKHDAQTPVVHIGLQNTEELILPLQRFSLVGRHSYQDIFYYKNAENILSEISFTYLVEILAKYLQYKYRTKDEVINKFIFRVNLSCETIFKTLKLREKDLTEFENNKFDFISSEQALVIGHNFHPTPKSRDEFSDKDMRLYSPEFKGRFKILWLKVDKKYVYQKTDLEEKNWLKQVAQIDLENFNSKVEENYALYPCHPWQFETLKKQKNWMQDYLKSGVVTVLGQSKNYWYPTSSLRTVYNPDVPYMLKYSLSVKLTNSIRHLLLHEAERGLQVSELLQTAKGKEVFKNSNFYVLTEPGFVTLKNQEGNPLCETLVMARTNPFIKQNKDNKIVLSTLLQDSALAKGNLLLKKLRQSQSIFGDMNKRCHQWFTSFLQHAVKPLITSQSQYGLLMGAHQQNLILDLEDAIIKGVYFRDCQGTGYTDLGFKTFSPFVKSINKENGNVLSNQMAYYLFSYYLIINSTFNVIAALSAEGDIKEDDLLIILKSFLKEHMQNAIAKDQSCLKYLLEEKFLMHKGNFLCAFKAINENTTSDPLALYLPIKNPLEFLEKVDQKKFFTRSFNELNI